MHLIFVAAGLLGALSALLGAIGAHSLALTDAQQISWTTAERYMMFHAVALIGLGLVYERKPGRWIAISSLLLALGCVLFSGSIFLMLGVGLKGLWMLTPMGGVMLILGWLWFVAGALYHR